MESCWFHPRNSLKSWSYRFQYTVPSHRKCCTAHSAGEGGSRQKKRTDSIWQRKPRFNKQGLYTWFWSGHHILFTMPMSNHLRKPGRDMWYQYSIFQYQIIWWTQNLNLEPGTLERPTSYFMLTRNSASYWIHDKSPWLLSPVQHVLTAKWGRMICLCIMNWGFAACFCRI